MGFEVDRVRIAAAVRELIFAIGEDPDARELSSTPARVADTYAEFFSGVGVDPAQYLIDAEPVGTGLTDDVAGESSADGNGELVLVRDIALRSVCEHHLLPFRGKAHIAYQPCERIVGLGALPKVVATLAARPQMQERLGEQIADALVQGLSPRGVVVVLEASHGCLSDRGSQQVGATVVTIASRGELTEPAARSEVIALVGAGAGTDAGVVGGSA